MFLLKWSRAWTLAGFVISNNLGFVQNRVQLTVCCVFLFVALVMYLLNFVVQSTHFVIMDMDHEIFLVLLLTCSGINRKKV